MKKTKKAALTLGLIASATIAISGPTSANATENAADVSVNVGEKVTLKAVAEFLDKQTNSKNYTIKWEVGEDDGNILSVDSKGSVTGKAQGVGEIIATIKGETTLQARAKVQVNSLATGINLKTKTLNLKVGETLPINFEVLPVKKALQTAKFKSENSKVATVSSKGLVKAVQAGQTTVTISPTDAGIAPFTTPLVETVTINATSTVTGVKITSPKKVSLKKGESTKLAAVVSPSNAFLKDVKYSVENNAIAYVDSNGKVTPKSNGTTTVFVKTVDGEFYDSMEITVSGFSDTNIKNIEITPDRVENGKKIIDVYVGEKKELPLKTLPQKTSTSKLVFKSENSNSVSISGGMVKGILPGLTKVTVSSKDAENIKDEVYINVKSTVKGISGPSTFTIRVGETLTVPLEVLPSTAYSRDILTSNNNPLVKFKSGTTEVTGIKAGTTDVVFRTYDGNYTLNTKITVVGMVNSFKIPFEKVKIGLEPYKINPQILPANSLERRVNYKVEDSTIFTIDSKKHIITPKKEGTSHVIATTFDGELVDEFDVVVDFGATTLKLYDANNNLIGTEKIDSNNKPNDGNGTGSDTQPPKENTSDSGKENSISYTKKLVIQKIIDKTTNPIIKKALQKLIS